MNKSSFRIISAESDSDLEKYYRLRYEVLRKPWGQPFAATFDDAEQKSLHILMLDSNSEAVACGRIQWNTPLQAQIRSMAVREDFRGEGLGSSIIRHIENTCVEKGVKEIILDARENALAFYEKNGYKIIADSYTLFGQIKHYRMSKQF
ncbi:MAG: GNAT family N-acetyltransferase [Bacteroidetes bacterium]|nr:MAG: GNAT family N-acetyltransferase [Bacteroidota bacterium]REK08081.1 MAG: GNAT family N-acetyltransferase [Bacteroidota bacterium]REK32286.1 MAG: GNAT family N-acetyltransferase [Bacteroidota bacterium]REK49519.1 MAG: GNAT family N-acetyltransferase [Bacteroidota bacterium]